MTNVNANTPFRADCGTGPAKVVILRHEIPLLLFETQNPPHSIHLKIKAIVFVWGYISYMNEYKRRGNLSV
ncbi:hypothetical protein DMN57_19795 [Escherichia coli]|nr:hypothetical protein [Escherichia coli]